MLGIKHKIFVIYLFKNIKKFILICDMKLMKNN